MTVRKTTIFGQQFDAGKGHSLLWFVMMVVITFCYVYQFDLSIIGLSKEIHSVRIAAVAILVLAIFNGLLSKRKRLEGLAGTHFKHFVVVHVFLLIYMIVLALLLGPWTGIHMLVVLINTFLFVFIPIIAFYQIIDSFDAFMRILLWVTIVQAIIIWICVLNPQIATVIDIAFNSFGDNEMSQMRTGYAGGLGCITYSGVVRFSVGLVACVYFCLKKHSLLYLFLLLALGFTCSMIARTGIFVTGLAFIVVFVYYFRKRKEYALRILVLIGLVAFVAFLCISNSKKYSSFIEERFVRTKNLVEEQSGETSFMETSFFQGYFHGVDTKIPDLSFETIVGTGVISGKSGNEIEVNVDGGFYRLYVGYGLVLSVLFYFYFFVGFYILSIKNKDFSKRLTFLLMLLMILVGEFKEWNIYSSCHVTVFFLMALLVSKEFEEKMVSKENVP